MPVTPFRAFALFQIYKPDVPVIFRNRKVLMGILIFMKNLEKFPSSVLAGLCK